MEALTRGEVLGRIIERADLEQFTDRVLDSWNLDLMIRWLVRGEPPAEHDLDVFREHARARAREGFAPDVIPANFRRGARFAWRAMLEAATEDEQAALLESADLLFEYVDRVSRIYSEGYALAA
jgi:hypothetical protein